MWNWTRLRKSRDNRMVREKKQNTPETTSVLETATKEKISWNNVTMRHQRSSRRRCGFDIFTHCVPHMSHKKHHVYHNPMTVYTVTPGQNCQLLLKSVVSKCIRKWCLWNFSYNATRFFFPFLFIYFQFFHLLWAWIFLTSSNLTINLS